MLSQHFVNDVDKAYDDYRRVPKPTLKRTSKFEQATNSNSLTNTHKINDIVTVVMTNEPHR